MRHVPCKSEYIHVSLCVFGALKKRNQSSKTRTDLLGRMISNRSPRLIQTDEKIVLSLRLSELGVRACGDWGMRDESGRFFLGSQNNKRISYGLEVVDR